MLFQSFVFVSSISENTKWTIFLMSGWILFSKSCVLLFIHYNYNLQIRCFFPDTYVFDFPLFFSCLLVRSLFFEAICIILKHIRLSVRQTVTSKAFQISLISVLRKISIRIIIVCPKFVSSESLWKWYFGKLWNRYDLVSRRTSCRVVG